MPNFERERSEYVFEVRSAQLKALLAIAAKEDQSLEGVIMSALDQFIEREEESCPKNI